MNAMRKNTKNVNNEIIDSNDVADSTVFVSNGFELYTKI